MLVRCVHAGSGLKSPECLDKCSNKSGRTAIAKTGQGDHGPAEAFGIAMQSAAASIKALDSSMATLHFRLLAHPTHMSGTQRRPSSIHSPLTSQWRTLPVQHPLAACCM